MGCLRRHLWAMGMILLVVGGCAGDGRRSPVVEADSAEYDRRVVSDSSSAGTTDRLVTKVLSGEEAYPEGFTVPAGEVWAFDSDVTTTVVVEANVVVKGVLRMRPANHDVVHTLRFEGIDESAFVGGGMAVVDSDVGLWVVGEGRMDIVGTQKVGWNRSGADPAWQEDDEVRVAPIDAGNGAAAAGVRDGDAFAELELGRGVPSVSHAGDVYPAEVVNLTRNVRITGTGDGEADPAGNGRAHIWINSSQPQTIRFAELRHLGPRHAAEDGRGTEGVPGRYPLHLHMSGDGSRGTVIEGVVVRDSGNHAFVPHASHGVTLRDTVAYNVFEDAYWWDPDEVAPSGPAVNATDDLRIEHAMAAVVRSDGDRRHAEPLAGFVLGQGANAAITDSVAVGIEGTESTGFHWPASANAAIDNVWEFRGNVAHDNAGSGIFVWQNDDNDHVVQDFTGFHNGTYAVDHGAALNSFRYEDLVLFGNGRAGIRSIAAASGQEQEWQGIDTDGIVISGRPIAGTRPVIFRDVTDRGTIRVVEQRGSAPSIYEFHDAHTGTGEPLTAACFDIIRKVSQIVVYDGGGSFEP
jgi:hypothetical protein